MNQKKIFVVGGNGQLGTALKKVFPQAKFVDRDEFDMTDDSEYEKENWDEYDTIINAAAYTDVDGAESDEGRKQAWQINALAVGKLAKVANKHGLTLVHISSDYVFDGTANDHLEDEPFSPLGVYGQTKAAGDIAAMLSLKHYILRTSWVVGEGKNFVRTMKGLAEKGVKPSVVNDQFGRLTFTEQIAEAIDFLLKSNAPFGIYNISNDGPVVSWADLAQRVFELLGKPDSDVTPISTEKYFEGKSGIAPRPKYSTLDLNKIKGLGFKPGKWEDALEQYLKQ